MVKKVSAIKTSDTSHLIKKADCIAKTSQIEKKLDGDYGKNITSQEVYKVRADNFPVSLAQGKLAAKDDIAGLV